MLIENRGGADGNIGFARVARARPNGYARKYFAVHEPAHPVSAAALDWLAAHRVGKKDAKEDAGTFVSRMRDEESR